jgi:hypothetical protein
LAKTGFLLAVIALQGVAAADETGSQPSPKRLPLNQPSDLKQFLSVAVHPYNTFAEHRDKWNDVFAAYHVEFLDRATAFNDFSFQDEFDSTADKKALDRATIKKVHGQGILTASYFTQNPLEINSEWGFRNKYYKLLSPSNQWRNASGSLSADPYQAAGSRDLRGEVIYAEGSAHASSFFPGSRVAMSLFSGYWLDYQKASIDYALQNGIDAIDIDSPQQVTPYVGGCGDFSNWGVRAFQQHLLQTVSPETLKSWHVADVSKFDVRRYFASLQQMGQVPAATLANPIIREWVLFNQLSEINFHRQLKDHAAACGAKLGKQFIPYYGNLYMGHPKSPLSIANPSVLLGQVMDVILIESAQAVPPLRLTTLHKLGLAMGDYEKPVWSQHQSCYGMSDEQVLPQASSIKRLLQLYMAETYAAGAVPEMDLGGLPGAKNDVRTLSVTPKADILIGIKSFMDFVTDHRQWFTASQPHNDVALVYSVPSFLWNDVPLWQKYLRDHQVAFMAFGRAMEEGHVPYDVVIFGHPRLWDDARSLARLTNYHTIILPQVDCISEVQWQAVERFVRAGGRLIVGGNLPEIASRDENYNPWAGGGLDALQKQPGQGGVGTVPMDILQQFYRNAIENATYAPALRQAILQPLGDDSLLRTDAPVHVGINVFTSTNVWILHLVNHQYQPGNDSISPVDGFSISLRLPPKTTICKASWFDASENVAHELELTRSGEDVIFRAPPLKVWNLIVLEEGNASPPPKNKAKASAN